MENATQTYAPFIGPEIEDGEPHKLCEFLMYEVDNTFHSDTEKYNKFRRCVQVIRRLEAIRARHK